MLLSIILIGSALLVSGAIAGLLTMYQIQESNNVVDSTKAFFGADSMIEWQTYEYMQAPATPLSEPAFSNGVSATSSVSVTTSPGATTTIIQAEGTAGNSIRTLQSIFLQ